MRLKEGRRWDNKVCIDLDLKLSLKFSFKRKLSLGQQKFNFLSNNSNKTLSAQLLDSQQLLSKSRERRLASFRRVLFFFFFFFFFSLFWDHLSVCIELY
jgi:hypothetical protein